MTSNAEIGEDVHALFQQLTGLGRATKLRKLLQTPFGLYEKLLELIENEAKAARAGRKARIIAKMNSLIEPGLIRALYDASEAGVSIDLIVRGICSLRPGVKGVSENIRVRSILGRFLEHHRMFHFYAGGEELVLASSADWMPRNLFRRVEVAFPIEGRKLAMRAITDGLTTYLEDNTQAWVMQPDGRYHPASCSRSATVSGRSPSHPAGKTSSTPRFSSNGRTSGVRSGTRLRFKSAARRRITPSLCAVSAAAGESSATASRVIFRRWMPTSAARSCWSSRENPGMSECAAR
jgi:polyphosphate kinase